MDSDSLDFTFDTGNRDRRSILLEAAEELDALKVYLGEESEGGKPPAGDLMRSFAEEDVAQLAASPVVYKITDKDFLKSDLKPPVRFKQLTKTHDFYWMYLPVILFPKRDYAFHLLEVKVEFNPGGMASHARPKAWQILPEQRFQTLLEMNDRLEIRIDENFQFSADIGALTEHLGIAQEEQGAAVDAKLAADMGMVAGPFVYRVKRAKIQHSSVGAEKVFWRLDGAEFFQEDDLRLIVIAQVPKEAKQVNIVAEMRAK